MKNYSRVLVFVASLSLGISFARAEGECKKLKSDCSLAQSEAVSASNACIAAEAGAAVGGAINANAAPSATSNLANTASAAQGNIELQQASLERFNKCVSQTQAVIQKVQPLLSSPQTQAQAQKCMSAATPALTYCNQGVAAANSAITSFNSQLAQANAHQNPVNTDTAAPKKDNSLLYGLGGLAAGGLAGYLLGHSGQGSSASSDSSLITTIPQPPVVAASSSSAPFTTNPGQVAPETITNPVVEQTPTGVTPDSGLGVDQVMVASVTPSDFSSTDPNSAVASPATTSGTSGDLAVGGATAGGTPTLSEPGDPVQVVNDAGGAALAGRSLASGPASYGSSDTGSASGTGVSEIPGQMIMGLPAKKLNPGTAVAKPVVVVAPVRKSLAAGNVPSAKASTKNFTASPVTVSLPQRQMAVKKKMAPYINPPEPVSIIPGQ